MTEEYVPYFAPSYTQGPLGYRPPGGPVQRLPYRSLKDIEPQGRSLLQGKDCDEDRNPRDRDFDQDRDRPRDPDRSRGVPETLILEPGDLTLPKSSLEGATPMNLLSMASWTQPDVTVTGRLVTSGNKSWEGIRFQRGTYEVNSRAGSNERFINCVFEEGWSLIFEGAVHVTFIGCRWEMAGTERRLRGWDRGSERDRDRDRDFRSGILLLGASTATFENCEVNISDGSSLDSWIHIGSTADSQTNGQILFQGLRARLSPMGRTESNTRQFTLIEIDTSVPILFTGGSVLINGRLSEIDIFSSSQNCNTVTLTVTDSTFTNSNISEIYVALIKNLWAVQPSRADSPSIKVIRVTLNNVRILYYRAPTSTTGGAVCSGWNQNILLSDVTSSFTTGTISTLVSPIDVEGYIDSTWSIVINNVNISANFANTPLRFSRIGNLNLLLGSGIFFNYTAGIQVAAEDTSAPGPPSWLILENIPGTITIIASPALSIVGFSSPGTINAPNLVTNTGVAPLPF